MQSFHSSLNDFIMFHILISWRLRSHLFFLVVIVILKEDTLHKSLATNQYCDGIHGYMDTITSYRHSAALHHALLLFFVLFSLSVAIYSHVCVLFHQSIDSRASFPVTNTTTTSELHEIMRFVHKSPCE